MAQQPYNSPPLSLSLAEVWQRSENFSRAIVLKKEAVGVSSEELKDARMERLPEIAIAGNYEKATNIPVYENGLFSTPVQHDVIHTLYKLGGDFYLNLYNGNKQNLKIEEQKVLHQIALIRQDLTTSAIRYKAASAYLELQKALIFKKLILRDVSDQEGQLARIRENLKNGVVLKSDVLRVELDLSKRKMALVQVDNDILIANQQLNILIGEKDEQVVQPIDSAAPELNIISSYEECLAQALQHSFPYHVSEQQTEISRIKLRQVKANVRPKIGMYGDFYYANPQIFLYPYNPYLYSLGIAGVKASFPLSSLYLNVHKVKAARLELEQEETSHKEMEDQVRQQVKETYLRYKEALVRIDVARVNVERATENQRIIQNTYFNNASLITDLLDADVQLLETKFELEAAKITAQNNYFLLRNIIGTL